MEPSPSAATAPPPDAIISAAKWKQLATKHFKDGDFETAADYFGRCASACADDASRAGALSNRALASLKAGNFAVVVADCNEAVELHPEGSASAIKCMLRRAVAFRQLDRLPDARRDIESVLALEPDNGQAATEMDEIKMREGASVLPMSSPSTGLLGLGDAVSSIHDRVRMQLPTMEPDSSDDDDDEGAGASGAANEDVDGKQGGGGAGERAPLARGLLLAFFCGDADAGLVPPPPAAAALAAAGLAAAVFAAAAAFFAEEDAAPALAAPAPAASV